MFKRIPLVCGNWKMNGSNSMVQELIKMLNEFTGLSSSVQIGIAPAHVHCDMTRKALRKEIMVGAQDCWFLGSGPHTGEVSPDMLVDLGLEFTLVGHSERRHKGETNDLIGKKAAYSAQRGLTVIGCVGENLAQREAGKTMDVIYEQMQGFLTNIKDDFLWNSLVLAYEPVWAIGTGVVAEPNQAQEVHEKLRDWIKKNVSATVADEIRILYGGSVTEKNCADLIKQADIDGFLVGGASLQSQFLKICDSPNLRA